MGFLILIFVLVVILSNRNRNSNSEPSRKDLEIERLQGVIDGIKQERARAN